jgi:hypothetical protein
MLFSCGQRRKVADSLPDREHNGIGVALWHENMAAHQFRQSLGQNPILSCGKQY